MGEEERRRCCLLGGCGCGPPGSAAQREAMEHWWTEKLLTSDLMHPDQGRADVVAFVQKSLAGLPWIA